VARLGTSCTVTPAASPSALEAWLHTQEAPGRFGCYIEGRGYQVQVRDAVLAEALAHPAGAAALAGLDVTLLHHVLLPQVQGGSANGVECVYTPDAAQAVAMVDRREGDCAWMLRGIPMSRVLALAEQGVMLPQKTTYFYPKLLSGLFIHPFE
jgi:uncharacterized protein (DUF1015 family)